jgi:hypothetical protein
MEHLLSYGPWYVPNMGICKDLQITVVKHEISRYSYHYSKHLSIHKTELILNIQEPPETKQLQKNLPIDLPTRLAQPWQTVFHFGPD